MKRIAVTGTVIMVLGLSLGCDSEVDDPEPADVSVNPEVTPDTDPAIPPRDDRTSGGTIPSRDEDRLDITLRPDRPDIGSRSEDVSLPEVDVLPSTSAETGVQEEAELPEVDLQPPGGAAQSPETPAEPGGDTAVPEVDLENPDNSGSL